LKVYNQNSDNKSNTQFRGLAGLRVRSAICPSDYIFCHKTAIIIKTRMRFIIMAVAHKSVISSGLVAIPVAMYTATQVIDIHFNQLHKKDI